MATYYRWRQSNPVYSSNDYEQKSGWNYFSTAVDAVMITSEKPPIVNGKFSPTGGTLYNRGNEEIVVPRGTYVTEYPTATQTFDFRRGLNTKDGNLSTLSTINKIYFTFEICNVYGITVSAGTFISYVYSTSASAYPNGGVQGDYYYDQRTTVTSPTAPTGLTYPNPITTPTVTVSWNAATSNVPQYAIQLYNVSAYYNGAIWETKGTTGLSIEFEIPTTWNGDPITSAQYVIRALDTNNQYSAYVNGPVVPVYFSPTLTVPSQLMQGQQATINWTAISGADSYTVQRKANTDADWTQVYSGTAVTFSETVGTWTSVQYRVCAVFGSTNGGWAESAAIPVVSASALVISGTDSDLGTVVNDIPYSISTDTGNQITATITVNSAVIFSGNVGNSTSDVIPVLDLVNGEGTIVIEASVQATSGAVSAVRTWTYTKAAITFPDAGSVAQLTQQGANIWPKTLAECVRLPGGKTLDEVTAFPAQVYTGSYVGTGTYGSSNPNTLTAPFEIKAVLITGQGNTGSAKTSIGWINAGQDESLLNNTITATAGAASIAANAYVTWSGNGLSWYAANAADQLNVSGCLYRYLILG